ncbi:hypothetical protein ONZ45_g18057 [Pleurotus djamor]|nr:hypothetical protein ONZ45_g18057 [Pleurotus djamor]
MVLSVHIGNDVLRTSYDDPPPRPTLFPTDTTPSVMQCLDNQVKFFQTLRTVSDCHLKELMAEQGRALAKEDQIDRSRVLEQKLQESEERAQIREDEMTERICVLEQQLKESQESQERAQANEDELKEQIWMLGQQKLRESQELQERARLREVEVNERINALEQELKESQDSQESLRSRLKAIVQDLQIEVLRDGDGSPKKRKREDAEEGELVYPYQRLCSFD